MDSIVRQNVKTQPGYTPYCGADKCSRNNPRTWFNGEQFECGCGWKSRFEPGFIEQARALLATGEAK